MRFAIDNDLKVYVWNGHEYPGFDDKANDHYEVWITEESDWRKIYEMYQGKDLEKALKQINNAFEAQEAP